MAARTPLITITLLMSACAGTGQAPSLEDLLSRVDERLNDAEPEMTACFLREVTSGTGDINGRIVVSVEIDTDGLVSNLDIKESELDNETADLCVADTIRRIFFEEWVGREPVRVTKPYRFVAGS